MTAPLFFYGSLRHLPLLEIVLGRPRAALSIRPAELADFAVFAVQEGPFPTLLAHEGAVASGIVVSDMTERDIARLNFYEGGFDYDLVDITIRDGTAAQVYTSVPGVWQPNGAWSLTSWEAEWAEMSCHAAREVMGYFGKRSRDEVASMFPQIRTRAWSRVLAARQTTKGDVFEGQVKIARQERVYAGFFALDEVSLQHETFEGGMSPWLERSYFVGVDAALVLPYDPVRDCVLLIEQIRVGPLGRGDTALWHLEPIAGRVDPGEQPDAAAYREAREEAGLDLRALEVVARGYSSPGTSTEYFHMFVGLTDLPEGTAGVGGLDSEDENIRSRIISYDAFIEMAEGQVLANTPLVLLAYWLAHHRSRLRSA